MAAQFEIGKTYATRSICDHESWFRIQVVGRTAKTLDVMLCDGSHTRKTCRVFVFDNVEHVRPWGTYSMCPVIGADDAGRGEEAA